MTTTMASLDLEPVHDCFEQWREEQGSVDSELCETFSALEEYQSRLEDWQKELKDELDELQRERKRLERDRSDSDSCAEEFDAVTDELNQARQQMGQLTKELLSRTDELRDLEKKRAELNTELELARARDKELSSALEGQKQWMDEQRQQWTEELQHLRELVEARPAVSEDRWNDVEEGDVRSESANGNGDSESDDSWEESPVLGSIVAQFGKLRKQRSAGREKVK